MRRIDPRRIVRWHGRAGCSRHPWLGCSHVLDPLGHRGWSALRRRSIQQELDLAKELPASSATRARLTTHVEEEINIYLHRIREQPTQKVQRPLSIVVLGVLITVTIAAVSPDANIFVILVVEGLLITVVVWAYLITVVVWAYAVFARSWWIKRSRRRHDDLLRAARDVADTAGAAEGQRVDLGQVFWAPRDLRACGRQEASAAPVSRPGVSGGGYSRSPGNGQSTVLPWLLLDHPQRVSPSTLRSGCPSEARYH